MNNKYSGYTNLLINKSWIRAFIRRKFYINNILHFVQGKTIDFGCGVGEVLKYLPHSSVGIDPDQSSIEYCLDNKLNGRLFDPNKNGYSLDDFKNLQFKTLLMNHVLEHIGSPKKIMRKLLDESKKIGIERIIVVVPCLKGFKADQTHLEYIDSNFFEHKLKTDGFRTIHKKYYPINNRLIGNFFRYQELVVVYERT